MEGELCLERKHKDNFFLKTSNRESFFICLFDPKRSYFTVTVGTPVTQRPPHRSRRAELPHRALQEYSLRKSDKTENCYMYQFRRNTRYGWLARPYPARTFTLQEAPSFAWRTNALELNELFPPAVLARFLLLHSAPLTAKIVTAEDGESWAELTGEPFSSLFVCVLSLEHLPQLYHNMVIAWSIYLRTVNTIVYILNLLNGDGTMWIKMTIK